MPHLDFLQAFASPDEPTVSPVAPVPAYLEQPTGPSVAEIESARFRMRFAHSELANISFVTIAILGGVLCAFYFFNGGDVLRAAAAWPREFLYPRPAESSAAVASLLDKMSAQPTDTAVAVSSSSPADNASSFQASRASDFDSLLLRAAIDRNGSFVSTAFVSTAVPTAVAQPSLPSNNSNSTQPVPPLADAAGPFLPTNPGGEDHPSLIRTANTLLHSVAAKSSAASEKRLAKARQTSNAARKKALATMTTATSRITNFAVQNSDQLVSILQTSAQPKTGSTMAIVRPATVTNRATSSAGPAVAGAAAAFPTNVVAPATAISTVTNSTLGGVRATAGGPPDALNSAVSTVSGVTGRLGGH